MGGVVSSGQSNDDLIDNLLDAGYIKTSDIERVFRAVDRAEYFLPEARAHAYEDLAWKCGNLHLSAPCIYSEVMESLRLQPGHSFLNLGSGTGYLSTMAGLVLGSNGINHGIELHADVIEYANRKLEEFKRLSGAIDEFDFCEPKFMQGNCLCLNNDGVLYDRVYCGASCPMAYEAYLKNLLKIGGILVMPLNDQLLQIKRNAETSWDSRLLMGVSFATLVQPSENNPEIIHMFEIEPPSLQAMCRSKIRTILRKIVESEHPPVKKSSAVAKAPKKKRALRRCVVAVFESDESSDEEGRDVGPRRPNDARSMFQRDDFFNFMLESIDARNLANSRIHPERTPYRRRRTMSTEVNREVMDTDDSNDESERNVLANRTQVEVEVHPSKNGASQEQTTSSPMEVQNEESLPDSTNENEPSPGSSKCAIHGSNSDANSSRSRDDSFTLDEQNHTDDETGSVRASPRNPFASKRREKFDSGLGDEIVEHHQCVSSSEDEDNVRVHYGLGNEDGGNNNNGPRSLHSVTINIKPNEENGGGENASNVRPSSTTTTTTSSEEECWEHGSQRDVGHKMYQSAYTEHMKAKIQLLPLPSILKNFMNFYREF